MPRLIPVFHCLASASTLANTQPVVRLSITPQHRLQFGEKKPT